MGGGTAMRAAGKIAGLGVFNGRLRSGLSSAPPTSQSLRNVSRPVAATISSGKVSGGDVAEAQKATWEMVDDWEFTGGVGDVLAESSEPIARVVFGGVPNLEEAKEATSELKDALDKVYLSSPNSSISEYWDPDQVSSLPLLANSEYLETNSCISCDPKAASVPKPAIQAFKLLGESPDAQSVVASIACDPNVWDAVLRNDAFIDFIQSQKNNDVLQDQGSPKMLDETSDSSQVGDNESQYADSGSPPMDFFHTVKHTVVEMVDPNVWDAVLKNDVLIDFIQSQKKNDVLQDQGSPKMLDETSDSSQVGNNESQYADSGSLPMDFFHTVKHTVVEMVNNVADYLQNIFGFSAADKTSAEPDARANVFEKTLGASFIGLAMMVIMVVLLKRA